MPKKTDSKSKKGFKGLRLCKKPAPDVADQEQEAIAVEFNGEEFAKSVWKAIHGKLPERGE